ncbi:CDP-archaeol synthase [uncultured Desulfobacter sp.]|uniref:CDP-archaeol synthase n=1 Tax=uncultured Desulfobacter sp. TaxID=240139 RepID=UPI0029C8386E|nr:CDP-archaeol synthase [uncultured Desulfobacter sp.]
MRGHILIANLKFLILLWGINLTPVLLAYLMEEKWDTPVDGCMQFRDGRPLLGNHKTVRGVVGGILAGGAGALILNLPLWVGVLIGMLSMAGDLLNSFIKRRLGKTEGQEFPVMDQLLEGALPLVVLVLLAQVSLAGGIFLLLIFIATAHAGANFLNQVLRAEPFAGYTRRLRSRTRFREWRGCQTIGYPFHPIINIERTLYYHAFMKTVFKGLGLYAKGKQNALDIHCRKLEFVFPNLPPAFDQYTILFISDLHLDCMEGITEKAREVVHGLSPDLCILGGDYRTECWGSYSIAMENIKNLLADISPQDGIFAVLGNHDCLEMVSPLRERGVRFLINDNAVIERAGDRIWIAGVDDPYYFEGHDLDDAFMSIPKHGFSILVAHTPAIFRAAAGFGPRLYLCGHTHAGQVQIPGIGPVITHARVPRKLVYGQWQFGSMMGYTSSGLGTSGLPIRFGCRGEVALIRLKRGATQPVRPGE